MEFNVISKLLLGCVSAIGTMALVFFNIGQTRKIKAELIEKFEEAVSRSNRHSVTELFRLIHGLRMSYTDIIELIGDDSCSKIIYALKKTPGYVSYENGEFRYSRIAKSKLFRVFDRWFSTLSIFTFGLLSLVSLVLLAFGKGSASIAGFIFLIFSSSLLALQLREKSYNQMVANLVEPKHNKQTQPTANATAD